MPAALDSAASRPGRGLVQWLRDVRSSSRIAFLLHMTSRVLTSVTSLIWTRLLLHAMGKPLNGLFLSFQAVTTLGGLGDLGLGQSVAIRTGEHLGRGSTEELKQFLAAARTIFLLLAMLAGGGFLLLSPWLGHWLGFKEVPGAGSLPVLFAAGALPVAALMLYSYVSNVNYACSTLTWPVIPAFVLVQASFLGHWLLARRHYPMWTQYLPYVAASVVTLVLAWIYLRAAFPPLAVLRPLKFDFKTTAALCEKSFWTYLSSLGNLVYIATDRLVIQAWFGPEQVPAYQYNYKVCELATFVILTASFVSLPKIGQWLADPSPEARVKVITNVRRLNQFQTLAGCAGALVYLAINNLFMRLWLGPDMQVPLLWQAAFALNLAVTTGGDAAIQTATRCGPQGIRVTGIAIGLTALLNVVLSVVSARMGHVAGIALATCAAQSVLSLTLGVYVCRHLGIPRLAWALRSLLVPAAAVGLAFVARERLMFNSPLNILIAVGGGAVMLLLIAWVIGVRVELLREEWALFRSFFRRRES